MKFLVVILFTALISFTGAIASLAKDLGLEVRKIPTGTTAHYIDSDGRKFTWTFRGKSGNRYYAQLGGSRGGTEFYNSDGFLTLIKQGGYFDRSYRPYFCSRKLGKCRFKYDSEFSKFSGSWDSQLKKYKDGYQFYFETVNKNRDKSATIFYKFGKFNIISEYSSGSSWYRLQKLTVGK